MRLLRRKLAPPKGASNKPTLGYHRHVARREHYCELLGPAPGAFQTTHWSGVVRAADSQSPEAASAMERLCRTYWYPLYAFVHEIRRERIAGRADFESLVSNL